MYTTANLNPDKFVPSYFEKEHTLKLNGQTIHYKTVAEDNVFYDKNGKPLASIYSYSYIRTDVEDNTQRPVVFGFNGGPGSASYYVHAGFLSTKRAVYGEDIDRPTSLGKYEAKDNEHCLLDVADIVVVEPVGTGYGLLIDENSKDQFFGIQQDAEAFLYFVEKWLAKNNRFLSPKYLIGESYGCTRNAFVLGMACDGSKSRDFALAFDGVVMIGNTITNGKYFGKELPVEHAVIAFGTYAAVNWYHNHPSNQTIKEFVDEAKAFAEKDYLLALFRGESLPKEERENVIEKVCYYTGVSREYLEKANLNINEDTFRQEVIKHKGLSTARCDSRITRPRYTPEETEAELGIWDDASSDRYDAYYRAVTCGIIFPMMGIQLDRPYVPYYSMWDREKQKSLWNEEETLGNTSTMLNKAMHKAMGMRIFFANGYYDTCTLTGYIDYLLNHTGLPKERITQKNYESGHMIYYGEQNVKELCADIKDFIKGGMPHN